MADSSFGRRDLVALAVFLGVSFAAAAIGSYATASSLESWYAGLTKPEWTPSGAVIGTIWTMLYTLMGIAAWLVWRKVGWTLSLPLLLFGVQLGLNVLWTVLFFGVRSLPAAFGEILVLWAAILATLIAFWRVRTWAGALFVPYLAWVTIAGSLNYVLWQLNP